MSIEGWVRREGEGLLATLRVSDVSSQDGQGERQLHSAELDCTALSSAVALAIALAIDPEAALAPPPAATGPLPPPPEPVAETGAAPEPTVVFVPVQAVSPRPRDRAGDLTARGVVVSGALPRTAVGGALAGHVQLAERWSGGIALSYLPEVRTDSERAAFGLTMAQLTGCFVALGFDAGGVEGCAGIEGGALHAVSFAERPLRPGDRPWLGALGLLRVRAVVSGPLQVELGAGLSAPLIRHDFVVRGESASVFRPNSVIPHGFVGTGVAF